MKLKYTLVLIVIILITELSSKPISNEEKLIQSTAVTPSLEPNTTEETSPEWGCDDSCQQIKRLRELLNKKRTTLSFSL